MLPIASTLPSLLHHSSALVVGGRGGRLSSSNVPNDDNNNDGGNLLVRNALLSRIREGQDNLLLLLRRRRQANEEEQLRTLQKLHHHRPELSSPSSLSLSSSPPPILQPGHPLVVRRRGQYPLRGDPTSEEATPTTTPGKAHLYLSNAKLESSLLTHRSIDPHDGAANCFVGSIRERAPTLLLAGATNPSVATATTTSPAALSQILTSAHVPDKARTTLPQLTAPRTSDHASQLTLLGAQKRKDYPSIDLVTSMYGGHQQKQRQHDNINNNKRRRILQDTSNLIAATLASTAPTLALGGGGGEVHRASPTPRQHHHQEQENLRLVQLENTTLRRELHELQQLRQHGDQRRRAIAALLLRHAQSLC